RKLHGTSGRPIRERPAEDDNSQGVPATASRAPGRRRSPGSSGESQLSARRITNSTHPGCGGTRFTGLGSTIVRTAVIFLSSCSMRDCGAHGTSLRGVDVREPIVIAVSRTLCRSATATIVLIVVAASGLSCGHTDNAAPQLDSTNAVASVVVSPESV